MGSSSGPQARPAARPSFFVRRKCGWQSLEGALGVRRYEAADIARPRVTDTTCLQRGSSAAGDLCDCFSTPNAHKSARHYDFDKMQRPPNTDKKPRTSYHIIMMRPSDRVHQMPQRPRAAGFAPINALGALGGLCKTQTSLSFV